MNLRNTMRNCEIPKPPKPPLDRIIRDHSIGTCPLCGSTEQRKYQFFGVGKIIGCINPDCKNYYKGKT